MLKLKSTVQLMKVDGLKGHNELDKFFQRQLRNATREWLKAVLLKVPEYTGTARGTFKPLGRELKVAVGKGVSYYDSKFERQRQAKLKKGYIIIQGERFSVGSGSNNYAEYELRYNYPMYTFIFDEKLPYVLWNDISPAPKWITLPSNPPWAAFDAGKRAFKTYLKFDMPKREFYKALHRDLRVVTKTVRLS